MAQTPSTARSVRRGPAVGEGTPPQRGDDRHDRQDEQHLERLSLGEADGVDGKGAHDHDRGVDWVRVEESRDDEAEQARSFARMAYGLGQLAERADRIGGSKGRSGSGAFTDEQEQGSGEDQEQPCDDHERERGGCAVGIGADAGKQQHADQQRSAVAERYADA
jgi:hypothetical protein